MRTLIQSFWLGLGIGLIALVTGYMVGASQTPVISVAIPAVFGLGITLLGFIGGADLEKRLEAIKDALGGDKLPGALSNLNSIDEELKRQPGRVGKILVVFSLFYIGGLALGIYLRVDSPFSATRHPQLPWVGSAQKPLTAEEAVDWISLQEKLLELGYTTSQIREIYGIQVEEWKAGKTPAGGGGLSGKIDSTGRNDNPVPMRGNVNLRFPSRPESNKESNVNNANAADQEQKPQPRKESP